jgi:hypothetical protein
MIGVTDVTSGELGRNDLKTSPTRELADVTDGKSPGAAHGVDTDPDGQGVVTAQRLYQLVRDPGAVADHTFEIRFIDPGVQAHAFTFG